MADNDRFYSKATIKREGKKLIGIASTEAEDRHGEVVSLSGWDLKNAKKNCPLLWAHDHSQLPLGTVEKLWTEGAKDKGSKSKLMFEAFISTATERGQAVQQLIEEGILKSFSVGFRGLEMVENKFTQQELLEISVVNVPANPDALVLAYKSLHEEGISDETIDELGIPVGFVKKTEELETRVKALEESRVKESGNSAPKVDKREVRSQLTVLKSINRKVDDLLIGEKRGGVPKGSRITSLKVLKRSSDLLISRTKKELH